MRLFIITQMVLGSQISTPAAIVVTSHDLIKLWDAFVYY